MDRQRSIYDRDDRPGEGSLRHDDDRWHDGYRGEGYRGDGYRGGYDRREDRSAEYASDAGGRYDRYDSDRRHDDHERYRYAEHRQSGEERSRRDDDWDDRPRISGPVRVDPPGRPDYRGTMDRERYGHYDGRNLHEDRDRRPGRSQGERAEDFEQYRGRDAGFSWPDGSNSATWGDFDAWGNQYSNHSRREGIGWNRGSTRDPHFWSSPDRDR